MCRRMTVETSQPVERLALLLAGSLRQMLVGCYVAGSIALGEYNERRSDIDVIVVLQVPPDDDALQKIHSAHEAVAAEFPPYSSRLEVLYVDERQLREKPKPTVESGSALITEPPPTQPRYPRYADGRFQGLLAGGIDSTSRWILQHHGIVRYGRPIAKLSIAVEWNDVLQAMDGNLNRYHAEKAKQLELFTQEHWIEFLVLTLCRIVYTLETDSITTKLRAAYYTRMRFSERWSTLLDETIRIRQAVEPSSLFTSVQARAEIARAFVLECISFCNERYGSKLRKEGGPIGGRAFT